MEDLPTTERWGDEARSSRLSNDEWGQGDKKKTFEKLQSNRMYAF
jgi:hypothetical protein